MSVVEKLSKFRYVTATRECPMIIIRAFDLAKHRVSSPDLQHLKHVTSAVSDCAVPLPSELQLLPPVEVQQLLGVFQCVLQFSLFSQQVLVEQLQDKQSVATAEKVTAQHVVALEARLETAKRKLDEAAAERQSIQITLHALEKQVGELRTANLLLERELEFHRGTSRLVSTAAATSLTASKSAGDGLVSNSVPQRGSDLLHAGRERSQRHRPSDVEDTASTATTLEDDLRKARSHRKHRGGASLPHPADHSDRYVDWQSFSTYLMQQQQLTAVSLQQAAVAAHRGPASPASFALPPQDTRPAVATAQAESFSSPPIDKTPEILAALRQGLHQNKEEILQHTRETIANVEVGLTNRITRLQSEQQRHHEQIASQVQSSDQRWENAVQGLSKSVASIRDDTEQQIRLLKLDFSTVVSSASRQTSLAAPLPLPLPLSNTPTQTTTSVVNASSQSLHLGNGVARSASPSVLPPLSHTTAASSNPTATAVGTVASGIPADAVSNGIGGVGVGGLKPHPTTATVTSPSVATPGSTAAFGPRVSSAVASCKSNDSTSDDDDDPYIPMSQQIAAAATPAQASLSPAPTAPVGDTAQTTTMSKVVPLSLSALHEVTPISGKPPMSANDAVNTSLQNSSLNSSAVVGAVTRKPSSQMLKDTQDELQRLLDEEAAAEARKAAR